MLPFCENSQSAIASNKAEIRMHSLRRRDLFSLDYFGHI